MIKISRRSGSSMVAIPYILLASKNFTVPLCNGALLVCNMAGVRSILMHVVERGKRGQSYLRVSFSESWINLEPFSPSFAEVN